MEEKYFEKIVAGGVLLILVLLSFFVLKPVMLSILTAIILALIFSPVYHWLLKKTGRKNLSISIICLFLFLVIILPFIFLMPLLVNQIVQIYISSQQINFVEPLERIFPSIFVTEEFSAQIDLSISSFVNKIGSSLINSLAGFLVDTPKILLHVFLIFFTFFFVLKEGKELELYLRSLMPFPKNIEEKLFRYSKDITTSVLYGQFIVGIVQGVIIGFGFFIFGIPNALILTSLALVAGIFPVIGTAIVWVPVLIYLLILGNTWTALGILIFGTISSQIDGLIRPFFVSKKVDIHPTLVLISMIGGLFVFGILGFILGPLIISYLLIFLEAYRKKDSKGIFIKK
jgi:predicted PurR-regulated permease PerM